MTGALTLIAVRRAARSISKFRKEYVTSTDGQETLLEFAAMLGLVGRFSTALGGRTPTVVKQGTYRFARKPGQQSNFNYIRIDPIKIYFGVEFKGASGANHAPDVVAALDWGGATFPIVMVECKHFPNTVLPRSVTDAFSAVIIDLDRPCLLDTAGNDFLPGVKYTSAFPIKDDPLVAQLSSMTDAGWSFLETSCPSAPREHQLIGSQYGFIIHTAQSTDRLI